MNRLLLIIRNKIREALQNSILGRIILSSLQKPIKSNITIVCATRYDEDTFWSQSALGISLSEFRKKSDFQFNIHFKNTIGLPKIYNQYITNKQNKNILLFIHDDIWFESTDWVHSIRSGLGHYDIVGVAGNRRLLSQQPAWAFHSLDSNGFHWDWPNLSGAVAHGKDRNGPVQKYGHFPTKCKALDGVLIAVQAKTLLKAKVFFDERFDFHFYDLDFCRTATAKGLVLGTWSIPITHQSGGNFGSPSWHKAYSDYLAKWS